MVKIAEILNQNNAVADGMLVRYYGGGTCPLCNQQHDGNSTMIESGGSKAVVDILLANIMNTYKSIQGDRRKKKVKFMIGALVSLDRKNPILIAVSGDDRRPSFVAAASAMSNAVICPSVQRPVTTRGGRVITDQQLASWKADNEPLWCAAPKLIMEARRREYRPPWDLSEIWVNPYVDDRDFRKKNKSIGYTKHGWSIDSCQTCANVVPALMCTA